MRIQCNAGTFGLALSILAWLIFLPASVMPIGIGGFGVGWLMLSSVVALAAFLVSIVALSINSARKYAVAGALVSGLFFLFAYLYLVLHPWI